MQRTGRLFPRQLWEGTPLRPKQQSRSAAHAPPLQFKMAQELTGGLPTATRRLFPSAAPLRCEAHITKAILHTASKVGVPRPGQVMEDAP